MHRTSWTERIIYLFLAVAVVPCAADSSVNGADEFATYVHGLYMDELVTMNRASTDYYYHQDDLFNVMAVTDGIGAVVERYDYGEFGEPQFYDGSGSSIGGTAIGNEFLFNGRQYDSDTGLYFYRSRYMDPKAGRFISRDTIGLYGDPTNLGNGQAYVGNNPWSRTDPYGQWGWDQDWFETALNVLGGGFFSGSGGAAMHSFWVVSGGEQLSEMASGVAAMGSASAWSGAYNTAVEDTAAHYEQRIATHVAVNGGNVEEAIGTATGWRMVGADIVGFTSIDEARTGMDFGTGGVLSGEERVQRGLTGTSQLAGTVAIITTPANRIVATKGVHSSRAGATAAGETSAKVVPNPYGRLGGPAHRAKVKDVADEIRARNLRAETEVPINTVNGQKNIRFIDVVGIDPKSNRIVEIHQVGRTLKSNPKIPVARERAAFRDVRYAPEVRGAKRIFHDTRP